MNRRYIALGLVALAGCTSIEVRPVSDLDQIKRICIEKNDEVLVDDFLFVLEDGLQRHGVATEVYSGPRPAGCEYRMTYAVWRKWDLAPYLSHAELRLDRDGKQVAAGTYHLVGGGGLDLGKFRGTKAKMDPVIDEMMTGRKTQ